MTTKVSVVLNGNPFVAELKKQGFYLTFGQKKTRKQPGFMEWQKFVTIKRKIIVRLRSEGMHSASHRLYKDRKKLEEKITTTEATFFTTFPGMIEAINLETRRRDQKRPDHKHTPKQHVASIYWQEQGLIKRSFGQFRSMLRHFGYGSTVGADFSTIEVDLLQDARRRYETTKKKLAIPDPLTTDTK